MHRLYFDEFIKLIWKEVPKEYTVKDVKVITKAIAKVITQELSKGNSISYSELGDFLSTYRAPRKAYRPDLEEYFETRPTMVPSFKFRRDLRRKILDSCSEKVRLESADFEESATLES